jgi:hypothetical protein
MNTKLFKLLTAGTFALLSACGDNIIDAPDSNTIGAESNPVQTKSTLNVVVQDASTGKPITATVRLLATGDSAIADPTNGTAIFTNLSAGSYNMFVEASGYAPVRTSATVVSQISENIYIAQVAQAKVFLYPLTAKFTGTVYYTDKDGKNQPAKNADVALIIDTSTDIASDLTVKVKVDSTGRFTFSALPAIESVRYRIVTLEYKTAEETVYGAQDICNRSCGNLIANDFAVNRPNYILSSSAIDELFIVLSHSNYISNVSEVRITFSSAVDLRRLNNNDLYCYSNSIGDNLAADFAWNATGDILTIKPAGKWIGSFYVRSNNYLYSKNGKILSLSSDPIFVTVNATDLSSAKVAGLLQVDSATTDYNRIGATIRWKKLEGATNYRIYKKGKNDLAYSLASSNTGTLINDSTYQTSVSFSPRLGHDTLRFIVQAYNEQYQTKLEGATELKVWDRVKPSVDDGYISNYGVVRFGYNSNENNVNGLCSNQGLGAPCYYSNGKPSYIYNSAYNIYNSYALDGGTRIFYYYSYIYIGVFGSGGSEYFETKSGLDSLQFGFYSDLAYHLSRPVGVARIISGCTYFNELMDTTATLTATLTEAAIPALPRVSIDRQWQSDEQTLCFTFNVAPAATPEDVSTLGISATYSVSGLKDKIGNAFEINYGTPAVPSKKGTLDFRIKSIGYTYVP